MTGSAQEERRARVLAAVLELLRERGYDDLRVRDVWERTRVGTDTIYRYFGSRERMIAEALGEWLEDAFLRPAPSWLRGATPAEQVLSFTRSVWAVWEANPELLEPYVRAATTEGRRDDGLAVRSVRGLGTLLALALEPVDPGYREDLILMLGSATHSAMTSVIAGNLAVEEASRMLEGVVRRLAEHAAMDGHRPARWAYRPRRRTQNSSII